MNPAHEIWKKALLVLGEDLTSTTLRTWFDDVTAVTMDGDTLILCSPETFKREIILQRYIGNVERALHELFSQDIPVRFVDMEEAKRWESGQAEECS